VRSSTGRRRKISRENKGKETRQLHELGKRTEVDLSSGHRPKSGEEGGR
jgi:hypothetical protein